MNYSEGFIEGREEGKNELRQDVEYILDKLDDDATILQYKKAVLEVYAMFGYNDAKAELKRLKTKGV